MGRAGKQPTGKGDRGVTDWSLSGNGRPRGLPFFTFEYCASASGRARDACAKHWATCGKDEDGTMTTANTKSPFDAGSRDFGVTIVTLREGDVNHDASREFTELIGKLR